MERPLAVVGRWGLRRNSDADHGAPPRPAVEPAVVDGYAGAVTDTGHAGGPPRFPPFLTFSMAASAAFTTAPATAQPTRANRTLRLRENDFAYRSEHLMAVIGKQLVQAFYGRNPCTRTGRAARTGGRQGLRDGAGLSRDYDGILAGAPAIHWDRLRRSDLGSGGDVSRQRWTDRRRRPGDLAPRRRWRRTRRSLHAMRSTAWRTACSPTRANASTRGVEGSNHRRRRAQRPTPRCLTPTEASAIDKMWKGPVSCCRGLDPGAARFGDDADAQARRQGQQASMVCERRAAALIGLGGASRLSHDAQTASTGSTSTHAGIWHSLTYENYLQFFKTPWHGRPNHGLRQSRPVGFSATEGGKVLMWHGFADQLIPPGSIDYYDTVTKAGRQLQEDAEIRAAVHGPGVEHCGGGAGPPDLRDS